MIRETKTEILDRDGVREELVARAYRDLARIHGWLADTRFRIRAIHQHRMRRPGWLALCRVWLGAVVCRSGAERGQRSIWRLYTTMEFRISGASALPGPPGSCRLSVAPYSRQVIDLS